MSDHFDHYKRPPSRDNSVDRYSRAASRLSGGSRQSSVEKQQLQHQHWRSDDASSSSDKSFGVGASAAAVAAKSQQGFAAAAGGTPIRQPPPFEEIILRQRNLGQEIVPSPVGQPKRTESLYVNPNAARKETAPKVSGATGRSLSGGDGRRAGRDGAGCVGGRKPRLLPPPPPIPRRRQWPAAAECSAYEIMLIDSPVLLCVRLLCFASGLPLLPPPPVPFCCVFFFCEFWFPVPPVFDCPYRTDPSVSVCVCVIFDKPLYGVVRVRRRLRPDGEKAKFSKTITIILRL